MKKILCALLSILFIATVMAPGICLATEEESFKPSIPIDRYTLTSGISASLSISGGTAKAAGRVGAKYSDAHCSIKVTLQKKNSNGSWSAVKSWSASGISSISTGGSVSVSSGSYRTCVTATVTRNGETEYTYKYSATKTC